MKAKFINEIQKFEQGLDPKEAMGIGGIVLEDVYINTIVKAKQEWNKYVQSFKGKKISFYKDPAQYLAKIHDELVTIIVEDISSDIEGNVRVSDGERAFFLDTTRKIYIK